MVADRDLDARRVVRSLMVFADSLRVVANWYSGWLGLGPARHIPGADGMVIGDRDLEFVVHPADHDKNPQGGNTVIYWSSESVAADVQRLTDLGAALHRGPLRIDEHRHICQLLDPWGNVFGLEGSA
ncbi:VOC family protein [Speluncibacter jeojiensis]|uniref:VOC domain-containing protein n=1 Tax=Speluncibacter jeojiensis TaxID=2710754 RepID=A0A9X4M2U4_9ACTN|nr:hypothetical protein [Corynebacteriales bacterium D3-21]